MCIKSCPLIIRPKQGLLQLKNVQELIVLHGSVFGMVQTFRVTILPVWSTVKFVRDVAPTGIGWSSSHKRCFSAVEINHMNSDKPVSLKDDGFICFDNRYPLDINYCGEYSSAVWKFECNLNRHVKQW